MKVAVFGVGNVGRAVIDACLDCCDIELVGVVSRSYAGQTVSGVPAVADYNDLPEFDVAILSIPTRICPDTAAELLEKGICTVDSYDIHSSIADVRARLDSVAKQSGARAIISAGWDPGTDSIIRAVLEAMAPKGITYTNFGPGMSMGHSVAVKAIDGVKDALSMTIPTGTGIHRRMVYVELLPGAEFGAVEKAIKADDYFKNDETYVTQVDSIKAMQDMGHGVTIERKAASGSVHNQMFEYSMRINNPALTAQVMVSSARAVLKQQPGCYTLIEIPPVDFLSCSREDAVKRLV